MNFTLRLLHGECSGSCVRPQFGGARPQEGPPLPRPTRRGWPSLRTTAPRLAEGYKALNGGTLRSSLAHAWLHDQALGFLSV